MSAPKVPDMAMLAHVQRLCDFPHPYALSPEVDHLFFQAMNEVNRWHAAHSPFYRRLWHDHQKAHPAINELRDVRDCQHLPSIHANFFKAHEILSIPREQVTMHLTSSGTTGQKSQVFFDEWSIASAQRMVDWIFEHYGWATPRQPANYLLYSYQPRVDFNVGTSYTDNFLCKYAPVHRLEYALKDIGKSLHEFDVFGCIRTLQEFADEGLPVRIFGFPAFLYFTLERMRSMGIPTPRLHPDSLVFFGGGWKGHADKQIDKRQFYGMITDMLGIPDHRLRDGFGSVEHCVPYIECEHHNFHGPIWSRILIRDVQTLKPLALGETGYLQFITPHMTSAPAQNVLMGDLASLHAAEECACGLPTPFFVIHGRAGLSKNKSCAITAAELLKGRSA